MHLQYQTNFDDYRFGFNGQEKDNEIKGTGNSLSFKYRIYDSRLGKFLSTDPLSKEYPWYTPYQFAGNTPIRALDLEGGEPLDFMKNWVHITKPTAYSSTETYYTIYDKIANNYFTVFECVESGKKVYRFYGNTDGTPRDFGYDATHKTSSGEYRGSLVSFKTMDQIQYEQNIKNSQDFGKACVIGMAACVVAPVAIYAGASTGAFSYLFGFGLEQNVMTRIGSAGSDFMWQMVENGGDFKQLNFSSIAGNGLLASPLWGAASGELNISYNSILGRTDIVPTSKIGIANSLNKIAFGTVGNVVGDKVTGINIRFLGNTVFSNFLGQAFGDGTSSFLRAAQNPIPQQTLIGPPEN